MLPSCPVRDAIHHVRVSDNTEGSGEGRCDLPLFFREALQRFTANTGRNAPYRGGRRIFLQGEQASSHGALRYLLSKTKYWAHLASYIFKRGHIFMADLFEKEKSLSVLEVSYQA